MGRVVIKRRNFSWRAVSRRARHRGALRLLLEPAHLPDGVLRAQDDRAGVSGLSSPIDCIKEGDMTTLVAKREFVRIGANLRNRPGKLGTPC
jgi:hypothetical protein